MIGYAPGIESILDSKVGTGNSLSEVLRHIS